jgi:hypothetical protein
MRVARPNEKGFPTMSRTDLHRPSAIVPADYTALCVYALPTKDFPMGLNMDRVDALTAGKEVFGRCGKCGQCGAAFVYGALFLHIPSGDVVHMGHICADNLDLRADWTDVELEQERRARGRLASRERLAADARVADFFARYPYMENVLAHVDGPGPDMLRKVRQWGDLSDKAMDFACNVFARAMAPARPQAVNVPAPTGKVAVTGTIVSAKVHESQFGTSIKMTVKVVTPGGEWLCWGTAPTSILDKARELQTTEEYAYEVLKGRAVSFTATLEAGREPHFAFFKRPTRAQLAA